MFMYYYPLRIDNTTILLLDAMYITYYSTMIYILLQHYDIITYCNTMLSYYSMLLCINIILCYYDIYYTMLLCYYIITNTQHAPPLWPGLVLYRDARRAPIYSPGIISTSIIYIVSITNIQQYIAIIHCLQFLKSVYPL